MRSPARVKAKRAKVKLVCLSGWDLKVLSTFTVGFPKPVKVIKTIEKCRQSLTETSPR